MPITVGDMIIHDEYTTMGNKSSLRFAIRRFMERPQGVIIVVDESIHPLGVIFPKHIFGAIDRGEDLASCPVDSVMSTNFIKVRETDLIVDVVERFRSSVDGGREAEAIVVVDDDERLKGYFSFNDYRYALKMIDALSSDEKDVMNQIQAMRHIKDILKDLD